ncbi:MAG: aminotransferase class V-fold PLP-dependent enzyme [Aeromicrobium sp.]
MGSGIYHDIGVIPAINGLGVYTDLGGSRLSPTVWRAMEESNQSFIRMPDLLDSSGAVIADLLHSEAARVTPGASSAIALGIAACMTGPNARFTEQLPDTTGLKTDVLIQGRHRYKYDRMVRHTGAQLREVGNINGTDPEELEAAIGSSTAAICFPAHLDRTPGTVPLEEVTEIGHRHGIPTLVDAAFLNYPLDVMESFASKGSDLVIFSSKYMGGPNTGGFICGRHDLIGAVALHDFTRFEASKYLSFGRPFKLDRQLVVGVVVALQEWLEMDHEQRFRDYARRVELIKGQLDGSSGIEATPMCFTMQETLAPEPVNCLHIRRESDSSDPAAIAAALAADDPSILVHQMDGAIVVDVECMSEEEAELTGRRLKAVMSPA